MAKRARLNSASRFAITQRNEMTTHITYEPINPLIAGYFQGLYRLVTSGYNEGITHAHGWAPMSRVKHHFVVETSSAIRIRLVRLKEKKSSYRTVGMKVAFHLSLHKNHAQALRKNVSISLEPSAEAAALASIICEAISVSLLDFLCNAANVFL